MMDFFMLLAYLLSNHDYSVVTHRVSGDRDIVYSCEYDMYSKKIEVVRFHGWEKEYLSPREFRCYTYYY